MFFDNVIVGALLIFAIRVLSIAVSTVRVLIMGRASRLLVSSLAFFEALAFALTFGQVARDLTNPWNLGSYCLGYAAGTWVGVIIEDRIGQGYATVTAISRGHSLPIVEAVRDAGHGATRLSGEGTWGMVGLVQIVATRKNVPQIVNLVQQVDPNAFITVEETRSVRRGYFGYGRSST
jgi:uncharacterized protein YebE (UPF0316 family)